MSAFNSHSANILPPPRLIPPALPRVPCPSSISSTPATESQPSTQGTDSNFKFIHPKYVQSPFSFDPPSSSLPPLIPVPPSSMPLPGSARAPTGSQSADQDSVGHTSNTFLPPAPLSVPQLPAPWTKNTVAPTPPRPPTPLQPPSLPSVVSSSLPPRDNSLPPPPEQSLPPPSGSTTPQRSIGLAPAATVANSDAVDRLNSAAQLVLGTGARLHRLQQDVALKLLAGCDVFLLAATGFGKSAAFQVPALAMPGLCIVVSPLVSLMQDQVAKLRRRGIAAEYISSSTHVREVAEGEQLPFGGNFQLNPGIVLQEPRTVYSCDPYSEMSITRPESASQDILSDMARAREAEDLPTKFLYVTPERIDCSNEFRRAVQNLVHHGLLSLIVFDEAHCVTEWGHDFRPSYLRSVVIREWAPSTPVLACTATAPPSIMQVVKTQLRMRHPVEFRASLDRPNLRFIVVPMADRDPQEATIELVRTRYLQAIRMGVCGVIYALSRNDAEELAKLLTEVGISAAYYHARMPPDQRSRTAHAWMQRQIRVLTATCALGMGVDHPALGFVIHLTPPQALSSYAQEVGRVGRDGKPAECVLFVTVHGRQRVENLLYSSLRQAIRLRTDGVTESMLCDPSHANTVVQAMTQEERSKAAATLGLAARWEAALTYAYGQRRCLREQIMRHLGGRAGTCDTIQADQPVQRCFVCTAMASHKLTVVDATAMAHLVQTLLEREQCTLSRLRKLACKELDLPDKPSLLPMSVVDLAHDQVEDPQKSLHSIYVASRPLLFAQLIDSMLRHDFVRQCLRPEANGNGEVIRLESGQPCTTRLRLLAFGDEDWLQELCAEGVFRR